MSHPRLVFFPVLFLFSCESNSPTPSDTEEEKTLQVEGDVGVEDLAVLCEEYAKVEVSGSANLSVTEGIDLSDINCLASVSGSLQIEGDDLESIDLPDLTEIGEDLTIDGLSNLESLHMDSLMSIGGSLTVLENRNLTVASWDEICDVGTSIVIRQNSNLAELNLANLRWVNTSLANGRNSGGNGGQIVEVSLNPELERLDLGQIMTMDASLTIVENAKLISIDVGATTMVGGDLTIHENAKLESIYFAELETISGTLSIQDNIDLTSSEEDFPSLHAIGSDLLIKYLPVYHQPYFPLLTTVSGAIVFFDVGSLEGELNLNLLSEVGGDIDLYFVGASEILLSSLHMLDGNVTISHNANLEEIDLSADASWESDIFLVSNSRLEDLAFLANLAQVGGSIELRDNTSLQNLDGLHDIESIRGIPLMGEHPKKQGDNCGEASLLICGSPLTYEVACDLAKLLTEDNILSEEGIYIYETGVDCPVECPTTEFAYGAVCQHSLLDNDSDGFSEAEGDCNDTDPFTYPGAAFEESAYACMTDNDGDGWGSCAPDTTEATSSIEQGNDCNDADSELNGNDNDGDGYSTCTGDCDDGSPYIYPGVNDCPVDCPVSDCADD